MACADLPLPHARHAPMSVAFLPRHLVGVDRLREALQAAAAEAGEAGGFGQEAADRRGDDDGVGFGALAQACGHLHGRSEQVVAVGDRFARVDADRTWSFSALAVEVSNACWIAGSIAPPR